MNSSLNRYVRLVATSFSLLHAISLWGSAAGNENDPLLSPLYVRDGQLVSNPFIVFIAESISLSDSPKLILEEQTTERSPAIHVAGRDAVHVAEDSKWTVEVAGEPVQKSGTVLVFRLDITSIPWFSPGKRVLPVVAWKEAAGEKRDRKAILQNEVYIGNRDGAMFWTIVALTILLVVLIFWSFKKSRQISKFKARPGLLLITGPDGYLSLWRTQLMIWTFAVGGLSFMYGLVRLQMPEIPHSLVALMGLSLFTGGLSATQSRKNAQEPANDGGTGLAINNPIESSDAAANIPSMAEPGAEPPDGTGGDGQLKVRASWADLISTWNDRLGQVELSVPKAQMVVWTALIVVIFVVKSATEGTLWDVPWELVVLTGASQAGYVGEKYMRSATPYRS